MFKKKDYIKVHGIGNITCKPELEISDIYAICDIAENLPFIESEEGSGKHIYCPELNEYSFFAALVMVATDYDLSARDLWADFHATNLAQKLRAYYSEYFDEMYYGTMTRIYIKADALRPMNDEAIFNGVAKSLENVDIGDILSVANSISNMDAKEIVKAALTTDAP